MLVGDVTGAVSSIGQSSGLLIRWLWVRVPHGLPVGPGSECFSGLGSLSFPAFHAATISAHRTHPDSTRAEQWCRQASTGPWLGLRGERRRHTEERLQFGHRGVLVRRVDGGDIQRGGRRKVDRVIIHENAPLGRDADEFEGELIDGRLGRVRPSGGPPAPRPRPAPSDSPDPRAYREERLCARSTRPAPSLRSPARCRSAWTGPGPAVSTPAKSRIGPRCSCPSETSALCHIRRSNP